MKFYLIISLVTSILLLIDLYVFQAIKNVTKNYWIYILYGVLSFGVLIYLLLIVTEFDKTVGPSKNSLTFGSFFVLNLVPKLVIILFMFGEDLLRLFTVGSTTKCTHLDFPLSHQAIKYFSWCLKV